MTQLTGERLHETEASTAPLNSAPEPNDLTPPPAVPRDMKAEEALYATLSEKLGYSSHRAVEIDGRPPRAVIKSYGIARARSDGESYVAASVNAVTGTLAIAEGTGSQLGVRAFVEGFERSMSVEHTAETNIGRAPGKVETAMRRTIPKIIRDAQAKLGPEAKPTEATGLGVQIVDNKLVYSGGQPLLVYNIDTGTCVQLTHHKPTERGVYPLGPGRHIVALCGGANLADTMPSGKILSEVMGDALKEAMQAEPDVSPLYLAQPITKYLQRALGGSRKGVMVTASMIDVAEYTDTRSQWRKNTDWIHPVTFAYTGMAVRMQQHREKRQELYERWSQGSKWNRLGAWALRTADAGTILTASYLAARSIPGLDHIGHEAAHWTGIPALESAILTHAPHPGVPQTVADTQALVHSPTAPITHDIAPTQPTNQTAEFDSTYTALAHDPRHDGKPTTIWWTAQQSLGFYGHQAGLSDEQVTHLQHDPLAVRPAIQAFENDADNGRYIVHRPHDWVLANHRYQLGALNRQARESALVYAHQLGVEAPPAPTDDVIPALPPTSTTTPSHTVPEQLSAVTENITAQVAETLIVAGVGSGLIVGTADAATTARAFMRGARFEAAHRAPAEAPKVTAQDNAPEPEETLPATTTTEEPSVSSPVIAPAPSDNTATDPSLEPVLVESDLDPEEIPTPPFKPSVVDKMPVDILAAHRSHGKSSKDEQDERWEKFMRDSERAEQDETRSRDKSGRYKGTRRKNGSDKAATAETSLGETSAKHKKEKTGILNRLSRLLPRKHSEAPTTQPPKLLVVPNDQRPSEQASGPELAKAA